MSWTKENTILIQATTGLTYQGCKKEGYLAYHPYKGNGAFLRVLREICFRFPILPKTIWYNKAFFKHNVQYIIAWDILITPHYLAWLRKCFPHAQINYKYANMVGKAKNLKPDQIPDGIRIWTYDGFDAEKYGIRLYKSHSYFLSNVKPLKTPEYDVFFVGRDKGRGEWLIELEKKMQSIGLKTKFIITADGTLSSKKPYYQKPIEYSEVTDYLTKSRSVLNVVMEDQRGITVRDTEALFFGIKLLTTNKYIVDWNMYHPDNVYLINNDMDLSGLVDFLDRPVNPVDERLLQKHTMAGMIDEITG
jgi:hypothetical protein